MKTSALRLGVSVLVPIAFFFTAASARAASVDSFAEITDLAITFSDSQSRIDTSSVSTIWDTRSFYDGPATELYYQTSPGFAAGQYSGGNSVIQGVTSSTETSLTASLHDNTAHTSGFSACSPNGCSADAIASFTGNILLAPGASFTVTANYALSGSTSLKPGDYPAKTDPLAIYELIDLSQESFHYSAFQGLSDGKTGVWNLKVSNDALATMTVGFLFVADASSEIQGPLIAAPVPEPQTWVLLLGGLVSMAAWRRSKNGRWLRS